MVLLGAALLIPELGRGPPGHSPRHHRRRRVHVWPKRPYLENHPEVKLGREEERQLWALPLRLWPVQYKSNVKYYNGKICAPSPDPSEIEVHNKHWQTLRTTNGTYYIYSAHLDRRELNQLGPTVRILAVFDRFLPISMTYCQLRFEGQVEIVRTLRSRRLWYTKWGNPPEGVLQPYLIACVLPPHVRGLAPASVSLVQLPCDRATNNLRVHSPAVTAHQARQQFAVCVKGLDFLHEDLSVRLVEWIELVRLMGAHKIFFYELQVHPNISKVLEHYERRGVVSVTPITLPGGQPNLPALQHMYLKKKTTHKRQMELIPYNDCLYRNMYHYRWLALLDIDEVIVPLQDEDWPALMRRVLPLSKPDKGKPSRSSYHASNLYFFHSFLQEHGYDDTIPRGMYILQHIYHVRNFTRPRLHVKSFFETDRVLTVHNHLPLSCLERRCSSFAIPTDLARLQHYRANCVKPRSKSCKQLRAAPPARSFALRRWRQPLLLRTLDTLRALSLTPPLTRNLSETTSRVTLSNIT